MKCEMEKIKNVLLLSLLLLLLLFCSRSVVPCKMFFSLLSREGNCCKGTNAIAFRTSLLIVSVSLIFLETSLQVTIRKKMKTRNIKTKQSYKSNVNQDEGLVNGLAVPVRPAPN